MLKLVRSLARLNISASPINFRSPPASWTHHQHTRLLMAESEQAGVKLNTPQDDGPTVYRLTLHVSRFARPAKLLAALQENGIAALLVSKPQATAPFMYADFDNAEAAEMARAIAEGLPKKTRGKFRGTELLTGDAAEQVLKDSAAWAKKVAGGATANASIGEVRANKRSRTDAGDSSAEPSRRTVNDVVTPSYRIAYPEQLRLKQLEIMRALRAAGKQAAADSVKMLTKGSKGASKADAEAALPPALAAGLKNALPCTVHRILHSPHTREYRNKMTFTLGVDEAGAPAAGFRMGSYHTGVGDCIAKPEGCLNAHPAARALALVVERFMAESPFMPYDLISHTGVWRSLTVRTSTSHPDVMVMLTAAPPLAHIPLMGDISHKQAAAGSFPPCSVRTVTGEPLGAKSYTALRKGCTHPEHAVEHVAIQPSQQAALEMLQAAQERLAAAAEAQGEEAASGPKAMELPTGAPEEGRLPPLKHDQLEALFKSEVARFKALMAEAVLPTQGSLSVPADYASDQGGLPVHMTTHEEFMVPLARAEATDSLPAGSPEAAAAAEVEGPGSDPSKGPMVPSVLSRGTTGGIRYTCPNIAAISERTGIAAKRFHYVDDPQGSGAPATDVAPTRVTSLYVQEYPGLSAPGAEHPFTLLAGEETLRQTLQGLVFHVGPSAFFQTNIAATEVLYDQVREWAGLTPETLVLDVCCGTGTIGLSAAAGVPHNPQAVIPDGAEPWGHVLMGANGETPEAPPQKPKTPPQPVATGAPSAGKLCVKRIVGVELDAGAVEDAKVNAVKNGVTDGAFFIASRAENAMRAILDIAASEDPSSIVADLEAQVAAASAAAASGAGAGAEGGGSMGTGGGVNLNTGRQNAGEVDSSGARPDIVALLDPPRSGLHKSVLHALRSAAGIRRLVYVSCNPTGSFVNDAAMLMAASGGYKSRFPGAPFRLVKAVPVDLFPHTPHVELVAVFDRDEE